MTFLHTLITVEDWPDQHRNRKLGWALFMTIHDAEKPQRKPALLWLVLIVIGIAWGGTGPLSKLAVSTGYHPIGITLWSDVIGGLILTAIIFARGGRIPISKVHVVFYIICGLLGTALPLSLIHI